MTPLKPVETGLRIVLGISFFVLVTLVWAGFTLGGFVSFARYLPASAFIPLLILWAGIGEAQKLSVIFIGSFFQLVLMIAVTVGNTRRDLVEAAYTLGSSDRSLVQRVLIPGAAPEICEILRMVLGWA